MRISSIFKKVGKNTSTESFNYESAVEEAWRHFPEMKERVHFVDLSDGEVVHPGFSQEKAAIRNKMRRDDLSMTLNRLMRERETVFVASQLNQDYGVVFLWPQEIPLDALLSNFSQDVVFSFDHEFAHALFDSEFAILEDENLSECLADAYATIRHLQRYGVDSPVIGSLLEARTKDLIKMGECHFTVPVVEKILENRHEIDWAHLTPHETKSLAEEFACKYALPREPLRQLSDSFKRSQKEGTREALVEDLLSTDSLEAFKYGTNFLNMFYVEDVNKNQKIQQKLSQKSKVLFKA